MSWIEPLLVAIPLFAAAFIVATDHVLPRRVEDSVAIAAAAATCALALVLTLRTERGDVVHWFGGWHPRGGVAVGIDFVADPLSAGLAALVAGVVLVALVFSWTYLAEAARLFDTLMLVCCGAMCGFALSGDLFNMFVWLELMGVAAYALTGFEVKEIGPLQGAVNFAIVNGIGGYLIVIGIALAYARTGALNLAQIGATLSTGGGRGLVVVALTLIVCGFLCKAAVVPFHLWLADAYAVAPTPVCAVFAAVMTDIGLLGVARVYWTAFSRPFAADAAAFGDLLLALGIATALLGGVMAFLQRHLKRMLAYSVMCHIGIMLAGIGLLVTKGLAGTADLLLAHAFLVAGLFLATGVLLALLQSVDELQLRGKGRRLRWLAVIWFAAALGLAGPPYVGVWAGHALIDEAAAGRPWVPPLLWIAGALASGSLLRAGARIFLGLGAERDPLLSPEMHERPPGRGTRLAVLAPATAIMVALGVIVSVVPGLTQRTEAAAERFRDRPAYAAFVLHGTPVPHLGRLPVALLPGSLESIVYGVGAVALALALAAFGLLRPQLGGSPLLLTPARALKAVHSGVVGDYVMWLTVGTALVGGIWAVSLK
jgi:multicomponent Na+:H+ antiporter subunit D